MNPAIVEFVRSIGKETMGRWEECEVGEPCGVVAAVGNHSADDAEGTELDWRTRPTCPPGLPRGDFNRSRAGSALLDRDE